MLGLCPVPAHSHSLHLPQNHHHRHPHQFRSVSPPPPLHLRSRASTMPNAAIIAGFAASSTRPHAFTTGGTGLDGLQRDWLLNDSAKRQQQIQVFRPKQLPLASGRRLSQISPFSSSLPCANAPNPPPSQIRAHSPPMAGAQTLAQQLCCLSSCIPNSGIQAEQSLRQFLRLYDDRQFPIRFVANSSQRADRRKFEWLVNLGELRPTERRELIRRFAMGLPVEKQPYSLIALHALKDLISTSTADLADSLHILLPQLRLALNSGEMWKKLEALELLREIAQSEGIGPKLVPYFRILLPPLRIGRLVRRASTDFGACHRDQFVNAIDRTLLTLEQKGGPKAGINIKHLIPDYQPMHFGASFG